MFEKQFPGENVRLNQISILIQTLLLYSLLKWNNFLLCLCHLTLTQIYLRENKPVLYVYAAFRHFLYLSAVINIGLSWGEAHDNDIAIAT